MSFSLSKAQKLRVLQWYIKNASSKSVCEDGKILGIDEEDYQAARDEVRELLLNVFNLAEDALDRGVL